LYQFRYWGFGGDVQRGLREIDTPRVVAHSDFGQHVRRRLMTATLFSNAWARIKIGIHPL